MRHLHDESCELAFENWRCRSWYASAQSDHDLHFSQTSLIIYIAGHCWNDLTLFDEFAADDFENIVTKGYC